MKRLVPEGRVTLLRDRTQTLTIMVVLFALGFGTATAQEKTKRILIVGDSWTMSLTAENRDGFPAPDVFDNVLEKNGFAQYETQGAVTAWGGRQASHWAKPEHCDEIVAELHAHPTIDIVHLIVGGNDFLTAVQKPGFKSKTAQERDAVWTGIQKDVQTIVDTCLGVRDTVRVVVAGYDYLDAVSAHKFWSMDFHGATQTELNSWFTELGRKKLEIARNTPRCEYIQNWGTLQYWFGDPPESVPYPGGPPDYDPYPGGDIDAPMPPGISPDGIHPNEAAHAKMLQNAVDQFYAGWLSHEPGAAPPEPDEEAGTPPVTFIALAVLAGVVCVIGAIGLRLSGIERLVVCCLKQEGGVMVSLASAPAFCSHEHWGSFAAIGSTDRGFTADLEWGALPSRETGLMDLLVDPYQGGNIGGLGFDAHAPARDARYDDVFAWGKASPAEARRALSPAFDRLRCTGTYQALRRGIIALYDTDIADCDDTSWAYLDAQVGQNYARLFHWYRQAMETAHFTELNMLVWPEMYVSERSPEAGAEQRAFTHTLMRVDSLMDMWKIEHPRRDRYMEITGIDPVDAETWRGFVAKLFAIAEQGGCIGSKQAQAYSRPLEFRLVEDRDVTWRGDLDGDQVRRFQDWVMHACFKETDARGWPHHCHVGKHNLPNSQPLPLAAAARQYPNMKIVMLHCWPYLAESGYLAKQIPNIYIDMCWQVILNPGFFRNALDEWLGYVPLHKLTIGQDATSVEMAVGAASLVREILGETLEARASVLGITAGQLPAVATDLMHNNAVALYGIGEKKG